MKGISQSDTIRAIEENICSTSSHTCQCEIDKMPKASVTCLLFVKALLFINASLIIIVF